MTEPASNHAWAKVWIAAAQDLYTEAPIGTAASDSALIGIGYALLALVDSIDTLRLDLNAGVNMRIDAGDVAAFMLDQEQSR